MDNDPAGSRPIGGSELGRLRHESLRRTAPAVQHEVNNAVMVLASNLELLGRSAAEGAPRRQLDRATEAVRRLETIMRSFLDAARRGVDEPDAVSPAVAVAQALPLLRVTLGARFGFDLEAPGGAQEAVPARLDRARLDLALLCLVRDAAGRMAPASRIVARAENRAAEVALVMTLPAGAEPVGDTARLLDEAATSTGGRVERVEGTIALVWPRA